MYSIISYEFYRTGKFQILHGVAEVFHFSYFYVTFCWNSSSFGAFGAFCFHHISNFGVIQPVFVEIFDFPYFKVVFFIKSICKVGMVLP